MRKIACIFFVISFFLASIGRVLALSSYTEISSEAKGMIAENGEGERSVSGSSEIPELSWEILGEKGKHFHLSLSLMAVYTDNAFNSSNNKESDFSTYLSPEIWLTFPRVGKKPQDIRGTSSRQPGGLALSRSAPVITRRYQAHLMYRSDIPVTSDNSPSDDTVRHKFGGGVTYKGNRFQLDVLDRYKVSFEERGTGISSEPTDVDEYNSNFFQTIITFDTRHRFRLRFDYSNYRVDYDDKRNVFRERMDNSYAGYVYYKLRPKTALFVQYNLVDITYDESSVNDSKEHNFYGGAQWDITAKSKGLFKAGYGIKEFENTDGDDTNFILEAQVHYKFTPKTSLRLSAFRKTNESDLSQASYVLSNGIEGEFQQMLTAKITGLARLSYVNDVYQDDITVGSVTDEREDGTIQAALGLQYQFRRWLESSLGYVYTKRNSNIDFFDYTSNTVFLRITGSM